MIIITLQMQKQQFDLMVLPQQRISNVLNVLMENKIIDVLPEKQDIYSWRRQEYINLLLTFQQADIYSGDILELR